MTWLGPHGETPLNHVIDAVLDGSLDEAQLREFSDWLRSAKGVEPTTAFPGVQLSLVLRLFCDEYAVAACADEIQAQAKKDRDVAMSMAAHVVERRLDAQWRVTRTGNLMGVNDV